MAFASTADLIAMNAPSNRQGGNTATRYNWRQDAANHAADWYFESIIEDKGVMAGMSDAFIKSSLAAGSAPFITVPMIGWVAKVGPRGQKLASYSIAKYGPQTGSDWQWYPDAGNGILSSTNSPIVGNDPNDANVPTNSTDQKQFIQYIASKWGQSTKGGVKHYILDNEPSIWHATHRDVFPSGLSMDDLLARTLEYGAAVKSVDPNAEIIAPEEYGWTGYLYSGKDQQYASTHGWSGPFPDRSAHGNMDVMPWLLTKLNEENQKTGKRILDYFSLHFYPQSGEFGQDISNTIKLLRNRGTRQLWDPTYISESWMATNVTLIPRMKQWINRYYPGTKTAITEYSWGAENDMNGATTQADILGIFGREGIDMASRWTTPPNGSPTFKAFQIFRNYDSKNGAFGDLSVPTSTPGTSPDDVSAFSALRSSDGALTVIAINKDISASSPARRVSIQVSGFIAGAVEAWQLAKNTITKLPGPFVVSQGAITTQLPPGSVTIFVVNPTGPLPAPSSSPAPTFSKPPPPPPPSPPPPTHFPPNPRPPFPPKPYSNPRPPSPSPPRPKPPRHPTKPPPPSQQPPVFISTASVSKLNNSAVIVTKVTLVSGGPFNGLIDVEAYSPQGLKVFQQWASNQVFNSSVAIRSSWRWQLTGVARGAYVIKIGIFSNTWSENIYWNDRAATVRV